MSARWGWYVVACILITTAVFIQAGVPAALFISGTCILVALGGSLILEDSDNTDDHGLV